MKDIENFLIFLRFCLSEDKNVPQCVSILNWHALFEFSQKQGLTGIYAHTILFNNELLEECQWLGNKPNAQDVVEWMKRLILIQKKNERLNRLSVKTVEGFTKLGYRSCILKGQGNTLSYQDPFIRMAGDIDIWIDCDRWNMFKFVRSKFPTAKFKCQHIDFPIWEKTPVEIHFYPMYLENLWANRKLQQFFQEQREEQFQNKIILPKTSEEICIPTPYFNAIYQLTHINVHILIEGIGLRQFIDYYYVLQKLTDGERVKIAELVRNMNLGHLAASVMYIEKEILGLSEKYLYVSPDEKRGKHLMQEIEIGGNFGRFDTRMSVIHEGFIHRQIRKIINHSHFFLDYPSEELSGPLFNFLHFLWRQWYQLKWKIMVKKQ